MAPHVCRWVSRFLKSCSVVALVALGVAAPRQAWAQGGPVFPALVPLQGTWTTHWYYVQNAFFRANLSVVKQSVELELSYLWMTPLAPSDGGDIRIKGEVAKVESSLDSQGRPLELLTITLQSYAQRFNSVREVAKRNSTAYCGHTDWQPGVYLEVSGLTCQESEDDEAETNPALGGSTALQVSPAGTLVYASIGSDEPTDPTVLPMDWDHPLYKVQGGP